jgi:Mrp family chromosome partitioning ATPase
VRADEKAKALADQERERTRKAEEAAEWERRAPEREAAAQAAAATHAPAFRQVSEECQEANDALKYAIIGVFCCGIIFAPIAIQKALRAKKMIAANPNLIGEGKATAALVIAIISVALVVIVIAYSAS